jgi:hypothetical protein
LLSATRKKSSFNRTRIAGLVFVSPERNLTLPPCSIAEIGAPISESARTGDSLRTLPNRSSALLGQYQGAPFSPAAKLWNLREPPVMNKLI